MGERLRTVSMNAAMRSVHDHVDAPLTEMRSHNRQARNAGEKKTYRSSRPSSTSEKKIIGNDWSR